MFAVFSGRLSLWNRASAADARRGADPRNATVPGRRKVVKGQPLGGAAYQAVELAEQLHDDPQDQGLLFGRFAFRIRYIWFRNWVNSPTVIGTCS